QRRDFILTNNLNRIAAAFVITSNGGADFSTPDNLLSLSGTAPITIKTIEVNGIAYPPRWTTVTNWTISIPLRTGANRLVVQGYDLRGNPVANSSAAVTVTYTGTGEVPSGNVIINEIMYHPAAPDAEFIELHNNSSL